MDDPDYVPPRDLPGDYAILRSVGTLLFDRGRRWRWDGHAWQPIVTPTTVRGLSVNATIVDELARFIGNVMDDEAS